MSLNTISDKQLRDGIAHAKWSVQYDSDWAKGLKGADAVKAAQKLAESQQHLSKLVSEANRRGMDHENIPSLSKNDGGWPVQL
jgi:type VI protein secretion system component VasK